MAQEHIEINRLKEREDANKYPRRKCVRCIRYPCFSGQGIGTHAINFAAYGCKDYKNVGKSSCLSIWKLISRREDIF